MLSGILVALSCMFFASSAPAHGTASTAFANSHTDSLQKQKDVSMTDITGTYSFNGNGSTGTMTIRSVDSQGNLDVRVTFDGLDRKDNWVGTWDDQAKLITLTRFLPNNVTQNHIGYLGDNPPGPSILAGSFTQSDIPANAARIHFGWFAIWQYGIIP